MVSHHQQVPLERIWLGILMAPWKHLPVLWKLGIMRLTIVLVGQKASPMAVLMV
jgi:hypothetical protein